MFSAGRGDLKLDLFSEGRRVQFIVSDVYYIPDNLVNLLSYSYLCHQCRGVDVSQVNIGMSFAQLTIGKLKLLLVLFGGSMCLTYVVVS